MIDEQKQRLLSLSLAELELIFGWIACASADHLYSDDEHALYNKLAIWRLRAREGPVSLHDH